MLGSLFEELEECHFPRVLLDRGLCVHDPPGILANRQSPPTAGGLDASEHDSRARDYPHTVLGIHHPGEYVCDG